jgi:formylglycine-generating enzyme required for sulfatase activity
MKKAIYAAAVILFGVSGSYAGEPALNSLRASVPPSVLSGTALPDVSKGYVAGNSASVIEPNTSIEWITIPGGKFAMGTDENIIGYEDSKPIHVVTVKTFEMSKTDVTVEQYAECVMKGRCTAPKAGGSCNWGVAGRQLHPVNCVNWDQSNQYAKFKGARLPSEAEWEYAATSGGRNQKYPWGNDEATCDNTVMYGNGGLGCGNESTMPVCSKPAGNTAQGLCDMAGNVWQWVQDIYHDSYKGVGSAFEGMGFRRVTRGGSFKSSSDVLRADFRFNSDPGVHYIDIGFRLVKSKVVPGVVPGPGYPHAIPSTPDSPHAVPNVGQGGYLVEE